MVWTLSIAAILVLVLAVIVLLPVLVRRRFNRALEKLENFTGCVGRVRINLVARTVDLYDVRLDRRSGVIDQMPVVFVPHVAMAYRGAAFTRGLRELTIQVNRPRVRLVIEDKDVDTSSAPQKEPANLKTYMEELPAFYADIEVRDGFFQYIGPVADVRADIPFTGVNISIHGLTNRSVPKHITPIEATATVFEGHAALRANVLPLADTLTFAVTLELQGVNMVFLNNFLRRYARVDVSKGRLDVYAELGVARNAFKGYIKPILKDLDFLGASDRNNTFLQKVWERGVALALKLLKNHRKGEIATKIPFQGTLDNPNVSVGAALLGIVKNAFIRSVKPSLDNVISAGTLWKSARAVTSDLLDGFIQRRKRA